LTENLESRVMGIDYGKVRIGIALSDPFHKFAYHFTTLKNDSSLRKKLKEIIIDKNVKKIILGLPSSEFKSSIKLTEEVHKFKISIESENNIEVILWDEEYSSAIAKEKIIEAVTKKSKRRKKDLLDSYSAAVILQEFLDTN
jgi:putative Holliday junction resolvase